jgi:hypothetical protein
MESMSFQIKRKENINNTLSRHIGGLFKYMNDVSIVHSSNNRYTDLVEE